MSDLTDERLARLARMAGSDEGFFVLALHSFVESHARADHPPLAYFDRFPELLWSFGDVLKSRGVPVERLAALTRISKEHVLTNQVRHTFARLDAEEVLAATHNFLAFCDLCGIDSPASRRCARACRPGTSGARRSSAAPSSRGCATSCVAARQDNRRLLERLGAYERDAALAAELGPEDRGARRGGAAGEGARGLEGGARRRAQAGAERRADGARAADEGAGGLPGPRAVPRAPRALHPLHPHATGLRAQPHAPHTGAAGRARRDPAGTRFPHPRRRGHGQDHRAAARLRQGAEGAGRRAGFRTPRPHGPAHLHHHAGEVRPVPRRRAAHGRGRRPHRHRRRVLPRAPAESRGARTGRLRRRRAARRRRSTAPSS